VREAIYKGLIPRRRRTKDEKEANSSEPSLEEA
jgi:hypothetical protein